MPLLKPGIYTVVMIAKHTFATMSKNAFRSCLCYDYIDRSLISISDKKFCNQHLESLKYSLRHRCKHTIVIPTTMRRLGVTEEEGATLFTLKRLH